MRERLWALTWWIEFTVEGCGAILADATHLHRGEMWPGFCDDCSTPKKKPHRDQGRAVKRRVEAMAHRRNATVYEVTYRLVGEEPDERPEAI